MGFLDFLKPQPPTGTHTQQVRISWAHPAMITAEQKELFEIIKSLGNECVVGGSRVMAAYMGPYCRDTSKSDFNFIMTEPALRTALPLIRRIFEKRGPPPTDIPGAIAPTLPGRQHGGIVVETRPWHGAPAFVIKEVLRTPSTRKIYKEVLVDDPAIGTTRKRVVVGEEPVGSDVPPFTEMRIITAGVRE